MYRRVVIADVGISGLLGLAVMYELADQLTASRSSLRSVMQHLLRWTVALLLLVAATCSALIPAIGRIERTLKPGIRNCKTCYGDKPALIFLKAVGHWVET
jgi:hypothetical protein